MTADWTQVRAVFEGALDLPAAERAEFLAARCGTNGALRAEVEELLRASDAADALEPIPGAGLPSLLHQLALPELRTQRVGGYQLGELIGSGGMGVVFRATQDSPKRTVALKMLRSIPATEGSDSSSHPKRLQQEAEILAALQHPVIAQVYEAGIHREAAADGSVQELPWFAMELVADALPIDQYAQARQLSTTQRIELFLRVCGGVQAVHDVAILHRDLKPANILVDGSGQPKVIDFGVARGMNLGDDPRTALTDPGQVVGTLRYMAPEQLGGNGPPNARVPNARVPNARSPVARSLDARTDVYGLGLVLVELLTDRPAFDLEGMGIKQIADAVREAPTQRLDPSLGRDLQLVADTATHKDPARRYDSVQSLAADLQRLLANEPVSARPASMTYKVRLFARRNRTSVTAAGVVLLAAGAIGLLGRDWLQRADRAEAEAKTESLRANGLVDLLLDDALGSTLELDERLARVAGTAELRRDMLAQAVDRLATLELEAGTDPEVAVPIVRAYLRLGALEGDFTGLNLGDGDAALRHVRHAHERAQLLRELHPADPRVLKVCAKANIGLAPLLGPEATERSIALYRHAIQDLTPLHGADPLAVDLDLSGAYGRLVFLLSVARRFPEAMAAATARTQVTRAAADAAPEDNTRLGNHATSVSFLGGMFVQTGQLELGLTNLQEAAAAYRTLLERDPGDSRTRYFLTKTRLMHVLPLWRLGQTGEAEALMADCVEELRELHRREPGAANYRFQLGLAHLTFGDLYRQRAADRGDLLAARDHYRTSVNVLDPMADAGLLAPEEEPVHLKARELLQGLNDRLGD